MKLKLTLLALVLFTQAYAQNKNTLSVMYAPGSGDVNIHHSVGDFGYNSKPSKAFGLGYTRQLNKFFSVETGLTYSQSDIEKTSFSSTMLNTYYDKVNLVTIPLLAKFTFFKYLYVDLGFDLDFQTNYKSGISVAPKQSGIGFESGAGAKYSYKSLTVFVSPYFQYHAIVKFGPQGSNFELLNTGIKLGVGYNF